MTNNPRNKMSQLFELSVLENSGTFQLGVLVGIEKALSLICKMGEHYSIADAVHNAIEKLVEDQELILKEVA